MQDNIKCPVCGSWNRRTIYYEDIGGTWTPVEWYYNCTTCFYFEWQCFSDFYKGIADIFIDEYKSQVEDLNLKVYPLDEYLRRFYREAKNESS